MYFPDCDLPGISAKNYPPNHPYPLNIETFSIIYFDKSRRGSCSVEIFDVVIWNQLNERDVGKRYPQAKNDVMNSGYFPELQEYLI